MNIISLENQERERGQKRDINIPLIQMLQDSIFFPVFLRIYNPLLLRFLNLPDFTIFRIQVPPFPGSFIYIFMYVYLLQNFSLPHINVCSSVHFSHAILQLGIGIWLQARTIEYRSEGLIKLPSFLEKCVICRFLPGFFSLLTIIYTGNFI